MKTETPIPNIKKQTVKMRLPSRLSQQTPGQNALALSTRARLFGVSVRKVGKD